MTERKTTLTMMEMYDWGSSFIIQLKNGNYILNDGGRIQDLPYLFDYLEEHSPEGRKPIVEAWFISHAHPDHVGCLKAALEEPRYRERVYVEGFYFNEPSALFCEQTKETAGVAEFKKACGLFRTTEGLLSPICCPQMGQRYYFDDITVDVIFTQDACPLADMEYAEFNDTSTWLLYTIENQRFLIPGDADVITIDKVMKSYDKTFFDLDILAAFHHGINVYPEAARYFSCKTLLYPFGTTKHELWRPNVKVGNALLQEQAVEYMSYGAGTKVLTFPYRQGEAKVLPLIDWVYHPERDMNTLHHPERETCQVLQSEKCNEKMRVIQIAFEGNKKWRDVLRYATKCCGINTALIALKRDWDRQMLEVELRWMRIRGITPLPQFDFASVPKEKYRDIFCELIDMFSKPEYIHFGISNQEMSSILSLCEEYRVRPWIWADPDNIEQCVGPEWFLKKMQKQTS
jgi:hypothetical protein